MGELSERSIANSNISRFNNINENLINNIRYSGTYINFSSDSIKVEKIKNSSIILESIKDSVNKSNISIDLDFRLRNSNLTNS